MYHKLFVQILSTWLGACGGIEYYEPSGLDVLSAPETSAGVLSSREVQQSPALVS